MSYYGIACAYFRKIRIIRVSFGRLFEMEEILTASQVAALLKVHLRTVYTLARKGSIPARKFGGGWRFSKNEILKMVASSYENGSRIGPERKDVE